jgi:hypothetical protein
MMRDWQGETVPSVIKGHYKGVSINNQAPVRYVRGFVNLAFCIIKGQTILGEALARPFV